MTDAGRRLPAVRRAVVKVGSQVLTTGDFQLDHGAFVSLAQDVAELRRRGLEVVIVTSGAVAAGIGRLGLSEKPSSIPEKQAVAAVGQLNLMWIYKEVFGDLGLEVGQILLTRDDLENRRRYQNAKSALLTLFRMGIVPVINENDTVMVEEIKFGDNDSLSALVTNLVEADCLVILSDIEGLYDRDPKAHGDARLLTRVDAVDETVEAFVGASTSKAGTGGMATKLLAAKRATHGGAAVVIASGKEPHNLRRIFDGEDVGTFFPPMEDPLTRRKHWIAYTVKSAGRLVLDRGAVAAIVGGGKSLLPSGIRRVDGDFDRGDAVSLADQRGHEIGRGLVNYSAEEVRRIAGLATWEIADRLGYQYGDEVVHRDDLVVFRAQEVHEPEATGKRGGSRSRGGSSRSAPTDA